MSIWNKILLFFIAVATLAFFHAAVRTMKTFDYWSKKSDEYTVKLANIRGEIDRLRTADHEHPLADKNIGVEQLRRDLARLLANRGRIWSGCEKKSERDLTNGCIEVTVGSGDVGFSPHMLLYAFEETDDASGNYLGEYAVSSVAPAQTILVSTTQPIKIQRDWVRDSKAWVLYEVIPGDEHELFAALPKELKDKYFPPPDPGMLQADAEKKWALPKEFVLDGQAVNGKPFVRKLRDYLQFVRVCESDRAQFDDRFNALKRDESYLDAANADSQNEEAFATTQKSQAEQKLALECKQRDAAAGYFATVEAAIGANESAVRKLIDNNAEAAREIAGIQQRAAEQVDQRMRAEMARPASAAGRAASQVDQRMRAEMARNGSGAN